jgi:hypothetical protein
MYLMGSSSWKASAGSIARISAPPAPIPLPVTLMSAQSKVEREYRVTSGISTTFTIMPPITAEIPVLRSTCVPGMAMRAAQCTCSRAR